MIHVWKDIRQNYSVSSFITLLLGIVLIIWPDLSGAIMCYMMGGALILMGAIQLLIYIRGNKKEMYSRFKLTMGMLLAILGIWICMKPEIVLGLVPIVLGIVLIAHAIQDVSLVMEMKRAGVEKWWVSVFVVLVTFVLGVFLVLHPLLAFEMALMYVGIGLIYNGISDLALVIFAGFSVRAADARVRNFTGALEDKGAE